MAAFFFATLATFGVWETILGLVPWNLNPYPWLHELLKPVAVYWISYTFLGDHKHAFAVMGLVAIMHVLIIKEVKSVVMPPSRASRGPRLPRR